MSPATMPQNRQPSTTTLPPPDIVPYACQPASGPRRQTDVTAPTLISSSGQLEVDLDADTALEQLYAAHWRGLGRLAVLLLRDQGGGGEGAPGAFLAMHGGWGAPRDPPQALAYLRAAA